MRGTIYRLMGGVETLPSDLCQIIYTVNYLGITETSNIHGSILRANYEEWGRSQLVHWVVHSMVRLSHIMLTPYIKVHFYHTM